MIITNLTDDHKNSEENLTLQFAKDIAHGLNSLPKKISSKYFYDDKGSEIFQEITQLDDYYLTRSEVEILKNIKDELPFVIGQDEVDIIELGVGDGHKTQIILESFDQKNIKVNFFPIDISEGAMSGLEHNLHETKNLKIHGVIAEYLEGLQFAREHSQNKQLVLFLGSNIGNFSHKEAQKILKSIKSTLRLGDFLLIGFDLKKDIEFMTRAYSDDKGVTAKFNLNLLERINTELGGNFDLKNFKHYAQYNPVLGAMESYLISQEDQDVVISDLDQKIHFAKFEPIHLEYSFKYLEQEILDLALKSGFTHITNFVDIHHYYLDALWQVR